MDIYALFTDGTAEKIIIDSFPKKDGESGLIIRTTITSHNLKESAVSSIKNAYILLEKYLKDIPKDMGICIYGFSDKVMGSSTDLAFALSFAAYLIENNKIGFNGALPVRIAATGMIDERLNVRSVKGIKEKILAAIENDALVVFFPQENLKDVEALREADNEFDKISKKISLTPVSSLKDVFIKLGIINEQSVGFSKNGPIRRKILYTSGILLIFAIIGISLVIKLDYLPKKWVAINSEVPPTTPYSSVSVSMSPTTVTYLLNTPVKSESTYLTNSTKPASSVTLSPAINTPPQENMSVKPTALNPTTQSRNTTTTKGRVTNDIVNFAGNTVSNLNNSGFVSSQGNWVFYTNQLDVGFYKMKQDGSEKAVINHDFASYINIIGEYAYYVNKKNNSLYKVKTNGTDLRKLNDDDFGTTYISGNWIYYISLSDLKIYKIDTNGLDRTPLCNDFLTTIAENDQDFNCSNLNVKDGWVYFYAEFENKPFKNGIYKIKTDGSSSACITNESCKMLIVEDGWIYFSNSADRCLYKMDLNGSNKKKIINSSIRTFNVNNGWVYYSTNNGIYKLYGDDDFGTSISDDITDKINSADDWIYYYNFNDGNRMYKIRTNGKGRQGID